MEKYSDRIGNIITEQTNSEDSIFNQILFISKKMAIDFYDIYSSEWISMNNGISRNVITGQTKDNYELLNEFLTKYLIKK